MRPQLLFFSLLLGLILPAAEPVPPLLMIHAEGTSPIGEATVSITNPRQDAGLLITAVEFDGQLPEVRSSWKVKPSLRFFSWRQSSPPGIFVLKNPGGKND